MSSHATNKSSMKTTKPVAMGNGVPGKTAAGDRSVRFGPTLQIPNNDRTHHSSSVKSGSDKCSGTHHSSHYASNHSFHHSSRHTGTHHPSSSTAKPLALNSSPGAIVPFGSISNSGTSRTGTLQPFGMTATAAPRSNTASQSMDPTRTYGSSMAPYNTSGSMMAPPPRTAASASVEIEYSFSYRAVYKANGSVERLN